MCSSYQGNTLPASHIGHPELHSGPQYQMTNKMVHSTQNVNKSPRCGGIGGENISQEAHPGSYLQSNDVDNNVEEEPQREFITNERGGSIENLDANDKPCTIDNEISQSCLENE